MKKINPKKMHLLGSLHFVLGGVAVLAGVGGILFNPNSDMLEIRVGATIYGTILMASGIGIRNKKQWATKFMLPAGILLLFGFPLLTIVGIWTIKSYINIVRWRKYRLMIRR